MKEFYKLYFLLIPLLSISLNNCKENPTDPPEDKKPPGYQYDITWPSLPPNIWSVNHADMQRTGRSKFAGPLQGTVVAKVPALRMQTGVVFANDSVYYYGTSAPTEYDTTYLIAAKIDGTIIWKLNLTAIETVTTPLVDKNGTIYIANGYFKKIFAVNPDGTIKWIFETETEIFNRGLGIDKAGNIYAIDNSSNLYAIKPTGELLWKVQDTRFGVGRRVNITFSPDGDVIYIHGNRIGNRKITLIAFDLKSKSLLWEFGHELLANGPAVDYDGNIYFAIEDDTVDQTKANFYCLKPDGTIKWKYSHHRIVLYWDLDPTIDKNGNIYFGTDSLFSFDNNGHLRWKKKIGYSISSINYSPLVCDNNGNVYVTYVEGDFYTNRIIKYSNLGNIIWECDLYDESSSGQSATINAKNTMIIPSWRSQNLWILK